MAKKSKAMTPPAYPVQAAEAGVPVQQAAAPSGGCEGSQATPQTPQQAPQPLQEYRMADPAGEQQATPMPRPEVQWTQEPGTPWTQTVAQQPTGKKSSGAPPEAGTSVGAFTFGAMF